MLLGVAMYGYLIGNLASVISNLDATKAAYMEKMERVDVFLRFHKLPRNLQDRVRGYYRYLWKTHKSTVTPAFMEELPNSLRADLALHLNREIMEKVPFFAKADEMFLREIVQMLQLCIYLPGDLVIHQGDAGDSMFFLSSGEVDVLIDGQVVSTQGAGTFFGEIAVIANIPRKASIRAGTYCDAYRLLKKDFDALRARYEEFDRHVTEISRRRGSDSLQ
jgi:voltage-gated potassium channel